MSSRTVNNTGCPICGQSRSVEKRSKVVYQYDMNGNYIRMWSGQSEAARELKLSDGNIRMCCAGLRANVGGYRWSNEKKIKLEPIAKHIRKRNRNLHPIYQYDMEENFLREWRCLSDASRELGLDSGSISRACNGKLKQTGGFIWRKTYESK